MTMFATNFLKSLAMCLLLIWIITGFYPLIPPVDYNLNPHFMPLSMGITAAIQIIVTLFWGLVGIIAVAFCLGIYFNMTGVGVASAQLTEDREKIAPWAAPFAISWLGAAVINIWMRFFAGDMTGIGFTITTIIFGTLLLFVIWGTFVRLFPSKKAGMHN